MSEDIAWAAGLFEGEGYCGLIRDYPVVALGMTDKEIVVKFAKIMKIEKIREITSQRKNHNPIWEVRLTNRDAVLAFLADIYPYLGSRRQAQADKVVSRAEKIRSYPKDRKPREIKTREDKQRELELLEKWRKSQNARERHK